MPRNGAGVFSLVNNTWFPPVNGVLATATDWTAFITDVQNALTQSVSSDGQTPMTGNLPMGNNKITGLANGTAATDAVAFGQIAQAFGQCRVALSGGNLVLSPYSGNKLFVNGVMCTIPNAGISLAPSSLTPGTSYNIYAVATGTAITSMEASTTARATDTTYGNQIKSGDPTRVLVAKARITTGPLWQDDTANVGLINWFNRRPRRGAAFFSTARTVSGATVTEIDAEIRVSFMAWGEDAVVYMAQGSMLNNTAAGGVTTACGLDGAGIVLEGSAQAFNFGGTPIPGFSVGISGNTVAAEGFHFITLLGARVGGAATCSWTGSGAPESRTSLLLNVMG